MQNPITILDSSDDGDTTYTVDGVSHIWVRKQIASVFSHTPACFRYSLSADIGNLAIYEGADLTGTSYRVIAERKDGNTFKTRRIIVDSMEEMDAFVLADALALSRKTWKD